MERKCPLLEGLTVQSLYEKISVWEINVIKGKWISFINIDATHSNNGITYLQKYSFERLTSSRSQNRKKKCYTVNILI